MMKKDQPALQIQAYRDGDETDIIQLFETVFKKGEAPSAALAHWNWEFRDNPVKPLLILLAYDEGRLAGQYAANPRRAWIDGEEQLGALSLDTMTHPDYGGRGIFTALARSLYQQMSEDGFSFIYGFPNANSIHGFIKKLDWREIAEFPMLVRPLRPGAELLTRIGLERIGAVLDAVWTAPGRRLRRLTTRRPAYEIRRERRFGPWADDLWTACRNQHRVWIVRDAAYLNWRYVDRPDADYGLYSAWKDGRPAGALAVCDLARKGRPYTFIMDLLADAAMPGAADALLQTAVDHARESNSDALSALVMPRDAHRAAYRRRLFIRLPRALFQQEIHFGVRAFQDAAAETLYDREAWNISWGDTDVV